MGVDVEVLSPGDGNYAVLFFQGTRRIYRSRFSSKKSLSYSVIPFHLSHARARITLYLIFRELCFTTCLISWPEIPRTSVPMPRCSLFEIKWTISDFALFMLLLILNSNVFSPRFCHLISFHEYFHICRSNLSKDWSNSGRALYR